MRNLSSPSSSPSSSKRSSAASSRHALWKRILHKLRVVPFWLGGPERKIYQKFVLVLTIVFILNFKILGPDPHALYPADGMLALILWWLECFVLTTGWAGYRGCFLFTKYDAATLAQYFVKVSPAKFTYLAIDRATFDFVVCTWWAVGLGLGGIWLLGLDPLVATCTIKYSASLAALQTLILAICASHVALALSAAWSLNHSKMAATLLPLCLLGLMGGGLTYIVHRLMPHADLVRVFLKIWAVIMICSLAVLFLTIILARIIGNFWVAFSLQRKAKSAASVPAHERRVVEELTPWQKGMNTIKGLINIDANPIDSPREKFPQRRVLVPFLWSLEAKSFYGRYTGCWAVVMSILIIICHIQYPTKYNEMIVMAWWIISSIAAIFAAAYLGSKIFYLISPKDILIKIRAHGATKFVQETFLKLQGQIMACTIWAMVFALFIVRFAGIEVNLAIRNFPFGVVWGDLMLLMVVMYLPMALGAWAGVYAPQNTRKMVALLGLIGGAIFSGLMFAYLEVHGLNQTSIDIFAIAVIIGAAPVALISLAITWGIAAAIGRRLPKLVRRKGRPS